MLELTWRGANPLKLPNGETRKWLEDGDRLTITGWKATVTALASER
jgi:fumarylacetoacetase